MAEFEKPLCDNNHDNVPMIRVWTDGHGNSVYQCPTCGRKMQVRDDGRWSSSSPVTSLSSRFCQYPG